jgi:hypothetical protein
MMGPVEIPCYLTFCYLAYGRVIGWLVPASILSHMFKYGFFLTLSNEVKLVEPRRTLPSPSSTVKPTLVSGR